MNPDYIEYAVELYTIDTDEFVEQIDIFDTEEKAKKYITDNKHTLESNYVYCIRAIEYDRKENNELYETATYRIY